jgi:hypothetical protein
MDCTWRFLPLFMWRFQNRSSRLGACFLEYKLAKVPLQTCIGQLVLHRTYFVEDWIVSSSQIHSPCLWNIVDSGRGLSFRPARLCIGRGAGTSATTPCQSRLYPPVRDYEFGYSYILAALGCIARKLHTSNLPWRFIWNQPCFWPHFILSFC